MWLRISNTHKFYIYGFITLQSPKCSTRGLLLLGGLLTWLSRDLSSLAFTIPPLLGSWPLVQLLQLTQNRNSFPHYTSYSCNSSIRYIIELAISLSSTFTPLLSLLLPVLCLTWRRFLPLPCPNHGLASSIWAVWHRDNRCSDTKIVSLSGQFTGWILAQVPVTLCTWYGSWKERSSLNFGSTLSITKSPTLITGSLECLSYCFFWLTWAFLMCCLANSLILFNSLSSSLPYPDSVVIAGGLGV